MTDNTDNMTDEQVMEYCEQLGKKQMLVSVEKVALYVLATIGSHAYPEDDKAAANFIAQGKLSMNVAVEAYFRKLEQMDEKDYFLENMEMN